MGVHTFPKGIILMMNIIAQLGFELTTISQSNTLATTLQGHPSFNIWYISMIQAVLKVFQELVVGFLSIFCLELS